MSLRIAALAATVALAAAGLLATAPWPATPAPDTTGQHGILVLVEDVPPRLVTPDRDCPQAYPNGSAASDLR